MNKKLETDTTLADFRRRFPTTDDLVAFLLATPPDRTVTADQLYHEMAERANGQTGDDDEATANR